MIRLNQEYFSSPYYFYIAEKKDKISLYYSIANTLLESRKSDEKMDFDKKHAKKLAKGVQSVIKQKKLKTKDQIKKYFEPISKDKEEMTELVDGDGNLSSSNIPILDMGLTPKKTTDQTVVMARMTNNPVTRGYRKYYGESEEKDGDHLKEIDYSDAFGYEETKDMDGKQTLKHLVKKMGMEPDEAKERVKEFGKDPSGKRSKNAPKKIRNKKGFIDRMTLSEIERQKMIRTIEELLLKKKSSDPEISEKEVKIPKILKKNIDTLKKMAEKEGLTINQLIKMLKSE